MIKVDDLLLFHWEYLKPAFRNVLPGVGACRADNCKRNVIKATAIPTLTLANLKVIPLPKNTTELSCSIL
jgi:hypothetical protein